MRLDELGGRVETVYDTVVGVGEWVVKYSFRFCGIKAVMWWIEGTLE